MPSELYEILRRVMQLEIEREALKKESDKASKERLKKIEKELADLKGEADALKARWQNEKGAVQRVRALREQIEQTKIEIERAERQYDLNRVAELKYGKLTEMQKKLDKESQAASGAAAGQRRSRGTGYRSRGEPLDRGSGFEAAGR